MFRHTSLVAVLPVIFALIFMGCTRTGTDQAAAPPQNSDEPKLIPADPTPAEPVTPVADAAPPADASEELTSSQPTADAPAPEADPSVAAADSNDAAETAPAAGDDDQVALIPRNILFGNPDKATARLSPDGSKLSYLAPKDGVLNVWVGPVDDPSAAQPVTDDKKRGIRTYFWAYTSRHILYTQDTDGDEDWHVYAVDLANNNEVKDLTPIEKVNAQIQEVSERFPEEILVGLNDRNPQLHDVYRVNIVTGERELVQENPGLLGFVTDDDYQVRFGMRVGPSGLTLLKPDEDQETGWSEYLSVPMQDSMTTGPVGFDKTGGRLYMLDSRERNTTGLFSVNLETGEQTLLAENERADISGLLMHPTEKNVQAAASTFARREWQILDDSIAADLEYLKSVADGEVEITSRTLDDKHWIVAYQADNGPVRYYHYDREQKHAEFLFNNRDDLEGLPLVKMHPEVIKSRDDLDLICYLSLPPASDTDGDARPEQPVAMVLDVHGGPWGRDEWGFDPGSQLWANRGYAVLKVNFRGSTGLGKDFINASKGEWAGKMHDDLIDAVNWAVAEGIADPQRVAIFGGSYGGYATLVGLTFTPEVFTCGVDIVGPSNLVTLLNNVPPYWMPFMPIMTELVGDPNTTEGVEFLSLRSPLSFVDKIEKPLLIAQGVNDPRVKQAEADQIVEAMKERNIPVTYVLYPDEGHGFARPENRLSFYAVTEAFLAQHLGGRYEPVGDAFDGASLTVPEGAKGVPGLEAALQRRGE